MLSAYHHYGMRVARDHLGDPQKARSGPTSWLAQQRKNVSSSYSLRSDTEITSLAAWPDAAAIIHTSFTIRISLSPVTRNSNFIPPALQYHNILTFTINVCRYTWLFTLYRLLFHVVMSVYCCVPALCSDVEIHVNTPDRRQCTRGRRSTPAKFYRTFRSSLSTRLHPKSSRW